MELARVEFGEVADELDGRPALARGEQCYLSKKLRVGEPGRSDDQFALHVEVCLPQAINEHRARPELCRV
jgi:hypothetical protein